MLLKTPMELLGFYFTNGNSRQNKAPPLDAPQNCVLHPLKILRPKTKALESST